MLSRVVMTSLVLGCRAPHVHSLVRPCDGSLFPFNLLLLFVVHLLSFKSLVIEVAVAVLRLVSLLFVLLRSFGLGALWIAVLVPFLFQPSLFFQYCRSEIWVSGFDSFSKTRGIANSSSLDILQTLEGSWARARIHSLFDYSTFSILSQSRHKVFLHEQEHSPLIRHWGCQGTSTRKDAFSTEDAPTIRNTHTPKIAPGGLVSVYFWT